MLNNKAELQGFRQTVNDQINLKVNNLTKQESKQVEDIYNAIQKHDHFSGYSDDGSVIRAGAKSYTNISNQISLLSTEQLSLLKEKISSKFENNKENDRT